MSVEIFDFKEDKSLFAVKIRNRFAEAEIWNRGAQVIHYCKNGGTPLLWHPAEAFPAEDVPTRAGVPFCFPCFGGRPGDPEMPFHGFAWLSCWKLEECRITAGGEDVIVWSLTPDLVAPEWRRWDFAIRMTITVGAELTIRCEIRNDSGEEQDLEYGFHTYYRVSDFARITLQGLQGERWIDRNTGMEHLQESAAIPGGGMIFQFYTPSAVPVIIADPDAKRQIRVAKEGLPATMLFHPAPAETVPDPAAQWVAVESLNAGRGRVRLPAHGSLTGTLMISETGAAL
ncbi:MAG: hypothetical protein J6R85_03120 [Lentisphaeria bacterium]|nr:hypothetical protein [Lentisphaeria bacterium]